MVAIGAGHGAEADGLEGLILQPGGIGIVETGHGGGHTQCSQMGCDLAYTLNRAAAGGVEGADDAKQMELFSHGVLTKLHLMHA